MLRRGRKTEAKDTFRMEYGRVSTSSEKCTESLISLSSEHRMVQIVLGNSLVQFFFHFCVIVLADLILLGQCSGWRRRNFIKPCSFLISDHACVCFRAASVGDSVPIQPSLSEQTRSGISRSFSSRVGIYRKIKSEFTCSSKTCPYSTQTAVSQ